MNIIETRNLTRRFGRAEAVHELNLSVPEGSVTALLGPNGAGKTTTLKLLMNLLEPTSGEARVLGVDSRRLGEAHFAKIGYVSENQELPLWMTVRQLLDYCRPFYPTWDRALEQSLLRQFDLPPDRKLKNLSRGMLMKASLLSSLAYRPKLLVLDEPFSGLDPVARDDFVRGILETAETGGWSVLVSSHDIEEVERLVNRVVMLDQGRLRLEESVDSLLGRFRQVHLSEVPPAAAPPSDSLAACRTSVIEGLCSHVSAPDLNLVENITLYAALIEKSDRLLGWERAGRAASFVTTVYAGEASEQAWRAWNPGAGITVQPMTLRQIFISLARHGRDAAKPDAA